MSEEEAINILYTIKNTTDTTYYMNNFARCDTAIQTILDLYQKEKEKNKELDKENQGLFEAYNFNDTNLLAKILKDYRKEMKNSIGKDKIKAKIEEYHQFYKIDPEAYRKGHCRVAEVVLQELLEEEE